MAVELDIDNSGLFFLLEDSNNSISNNRRAKSFFIKFLNASFESDTVKIPIGISENKDILLQKIQKALCKYKIQQIESENIKSILGRYFQEKENFNSFSEKAKGIWDNKIDINELNRFKDSLVKNMTKRTLYDKQLLAAFHLSFSHNACNFSVPGAGKTSVVYGAYTYLNSLPEDHPDYINKLLIIGPLSSFGPWEDEYKQCFGREVISKRLSGGILPSNRERYLNSIEDSDKTAELTLMSYQSVAFNLEGLKFFLSKLDNKVMIVLDEAHKIKNTDNQSTWASSVLSLAKLPSVKSRVVLTGTPIPNGYEDIYNLYEFIWPDKDIINYNVYQLKDMSSNRFDSRIEQLIENISPFFIRISKKEILPPDKYPIIQHAPVIVPMGEIQREIYDFIAEKYVSYFEDNLDSNSATATLKKARFIRMMQAATNPVLLKESLENYYHEQGVSNELFIDDSEIINKILHYTELEKVPSKFEKVGELVSKIIDDGGKVVLWGTFISSIKQLQKYLMDCGIESELLIGEVPVERDDLPENILTREKIIREFHNAECRYKVIIANPFAVAESISLHKACHNAIYFERTFNAANFIQSKDRIHRVGLKPNTQTNYYYFLSENSIDQTIHTRLNEKETRMLELIESQEIPLISENMNYDIDFKNDIKAIIRDYVRQITKT
jgi:hypothetical protein